MKLILASAAAAALVLPSVANAQAGPSASTTANASAEVVAPLTIACTAMHFSQLAPLHTSSAVVTLPAQGTPLVDIDNIVVPGSRNNATPSNCSVHGEYQLAYTVTLPTGATLTNQSDSTKTMPLSDFTISTDAAMPYTNRVLETLDGSLGLDGFGVGATLTVAADQTPGLYSGTFPVSVQYN